MKIKLATNKNDQKHLLHCLPYIWANIFPYWDMILKVQQKSRVRSIASVLGDPTLCLYGSLRICLLYTSDAADE